MLSRSATFVKAMVVAAKPVSWPSLPAKSLSIFLRLPTGPLEDANNKIKTMKRQPCSFRDHQFFILKIYVLHKSRYASAE